MTEDSLDALTLKVGRKYSAKGLVPFCQAHIDDYDSTVEAVWMIPIDSPKFEVLEVRPRSDTSLPWYRVRLDDERKGWFNGVALLMRVAELEREEEG